MIQRHSFFAAAIVKGSPYTLRVGYIKTPTQAASFSARHQQNVFARGCPVPAAS
jgi:hypothetical protein